MNPEQELVKLEKLKAKELLKMNEQARKIEEQKRKVLLELKKREVKAKFEQEKREKKVQASKDKNKDVTRTLGTDEMREYLSRFPYLNEEDHQPKQFSETVDLHLSNQETLMNVNPKGWPEAEITWNDYRDIPAYWEQKAPLLAFVLLVIVVFFASVLFPYFQYVAG